MAAALLSFLPVALLLVITPGPSTALVVHSAARGGRWYALVAAAGNASGLVVWAVASMLGVSALVAASEAAYAALKLSGAVVLVLLGVQALRRAIRGEPAERDAVRTLRSRVAYRDGLLTSLSNPKIAVFYIVLLPQFVPADAPVLGMTLLLAAVQIALALLWHLLLATIVGKARRALAARAGRWIQSVTGTVLVGLGLRLAAEGPTR